jgi:hypothetical protein
MGDPNPPTITLPLATLPSSTAPGAPPLATPGKPASAISPSLIVGSASPFQIVNLVGSSTAGVGTYTGMFQVNFDQSKLVQALRSASTKLVLKTTSVGNIQTITSCSSTVWAGACTGGQVMTGVNTDGTPQCTPILKSCHTVSAMGPGPFFVSDARCAANEYVLNGGGRCERPNPGGQLGGVSKGLMHYNAPDPDMQGWTVDCYDDTEGHDAESQAWATCCQK